MSNSKIVMIKMRGCPMRIVKTRIDHVCHDCQAEIKKGTEAFRSLLDGEAGGLQRCDLICMECGEKCPNKLMND